MMDTGFPNNQNMPPQQHMGSGVGYGMPVKSPHFGSLSSTKGDRPAKAGNGPLLAQLESRVDDSWTLGFGIRAVVLGT